MPKHEKRTLLKNLGSKQRGNEIWPVYVVTLQNKYFYQKTFEKCDLETNTRSCLKRISVKRI